MRNFAIVFFFLMPVCLFGQKQESNSVNNEISSKKEISFEEYCKVNACYFMKVPAEKISGVKITRELESQNGNANASYIDYGIVLSENETQYFTVNGTEKILVALSLYVLRLNYSNSLK